MKKRIAAVLLSLLVMTAQASEMPARDAAWYAPMLQADGSMLYLLAEEQLDTLASLPTEEVHAIVEAMFLAVAGVREGEEIRLWKTLKTSVEQQARSAENASYRALTLPWLLAAFAPGNRVEAQPEQQLDQVSGEVESSDGLIADCYAAFMQNEYGQAFLTLLSPLGGTDASRGMAVTQAVVQRWLAEIDHSRLLDINSHYECWIYAPDSPIDYPVVQCGNNAYYLDHLFNRTSNPSGTLFMDYRSLSDFRDPNTLIYGHHMRDGSMFHSLTEYDTPGYFDAHPFMVIVARDAIHVVEVFAGYITDSRDHCYDIAISGEAEMRRFTESAAKKSYFDAQLTINCQADRLVTLSTCAYNFDNARCVVIGRLNPAWKRAE